MNSPGAASSDEGTPDEVLVQRLVASCQNGEVDAFGQLYDLYINKVYRYVYYRVDKAEVEDTVENVFVKVWEHIDQYVPGESRFSSWLFRIAHNLVVDHYRHHRKHVSLRESLPKHLVQSDDDPVDWTAMRLTQDQVRGALVELKESHQQILVLKYLSGFSNKEIAQILQRNENNVRILHYRALRALKLVLEEKGLQP